MNPGNVINTGDVVRIIPDFTKAAGIDYWGGWYGPEGSLETAPPGFPFPGLFKYSPILRFNNNPGGWVGSPQQATAFAGCLPWTSVPVRLIFHVNDDNLSDNQGAWQFRVLTYH